jgi:hypothetical protein
MVGPEIVSVAVKVLQKLLSLPSRIQFENGEIAVSVDNARPFPKETENCV